MNRYLIIVLLALTSHNSPGQTLEKYTDQLYFGVLSYNPDSSITNFLKSYVPNFFRKYDSSVKWTMYPPGITEEPRFVKVINSFVFSRHPYFNAPFKSGQLAITQKIYSDEKWGTQLADIRLWFEFDNEKDAKNSFKQLTDTFSSFNTLKRITSQQGMEKAEFTDKNSDEYYSNIQIILVTDYSLGKRFLVPTGDETNIITEAGYKILVETTNDLH